MIALGARHPIPILGAAAIALALARAWYAGLTDLSPDEAYYWTWSLAPGLARVDHPPLVAWLINASTGLFGHTELAVRLPAVLLASGSLFAAHAIGRELGLSSVLALAAAVLSTLLPSTATGAIICTPDSPAGLAWLVAILALSRLSKDARPGAWYLLGAACGLGLAAKLSMLLVAVPILAAFALSPSMRRALARSHPWAALALSICLALPFWLPAARAGFPSILFQLDHLRGALPGGDTGNAVTRICALLGGQLGLLTPLVALFAFAAALRSRRLDAAHAVTAWGFVAPLFATLAAALFTHPEQSWASLGHPLAPILAARALFGPSPVVAPTFGIKWGVAAAALAVAATVLVHVHAAAPFLPLPPTRDPVSRLHGWSRLAAALFPLERYDLVLCDNYGLAAQIRWQTRSAGVKTPVASFDRPGEAPAGDWILLDEALDFGAATPAARCDLSQPMAPIALERADGEVVRTITARRGTRCTRSPVPVAPR